ncbi:MAG: hypothetical protein NTU63_00045 [Candidatus Pacearchaeota archaeon]|nr:hypothetical protein [Candidatus Pacearchaeota archaeon]
MENLFVLSKFENEGSLLPSEQKSLCERHFQKEEEKGNVKGYQINRVESSIPETWCHICTPPDWGYLTK